MAKYVVDNFLKLALKRNIFKDSKKILLMGLTFKENVPDIRNSKSLEIAKLLLEYGLDLDIYDPVAYVPKDCDLRKNQINKIKNNNNYCGIIISVSHDIFKEIKLEEINQNGLRKCLIFDLKSIYPNLCESWRL